MIRSQCLSIMLTTKFTKERVYFKGLTTEEDLTASESLHAEGVLDFKHKYEVIDNGKPRTRTAIIDSLKWHSLIIGETNDFREHQTVKALEKWGLELGESAEVTRVLKSRRRKYSRDALPLHEFEKTSVFADSLKRVTSEYGNVLSDNTRFFDYQLEGAAHIAARKRLILGYDMGLGKTRTTLAGLTANPHNQKILIVTMSRNIADWVREMKVLGLDEDFIELQSREDMKSRKRIHLVSYERWAREATIFKEMQHECCPDCTMTFYWNRKLKYCKYCSTKPKPLSEVYSANNLPEKCPDCHSKWKKGAYFCNKCEFSVVKSRKKSLSSFIDRTYDAAAIDEAHLIKNGTTKRARSILAIKTKTRIALTGTPAENGAADVFWILNWVVGDSHIFENPFELDRFQGYGKKGEEHFRNYYGGTGATSVFDSDKISARATNQEQLWNLMDCVMIRKRKTDQDVEADIRVPAPQHRRIHLPLQEAERNLYDQKLEEFRNWYRNELMQKESAEIRGDKYRISTIEVCSWLDKLRKTASCPWIDEKYDAEVDGEPEKLRFVREKIKEYSRMGKKMLIFTAHKRTAEQLGVILDSTVPGQRAAYIHGEIPMKYRHELMRDFQDPDHNLSVLVMTMRTGAESYTLTEAKGVVLFDLDFNAKKIEQCYSRAVRLGQLDVVDVYWLIGVDTIDANMHALVLSKKSGVDLAIDREALDFDEIAKEFESADEDLFAPGVDYEEFASQMLARGTSRSKYAS